MNGDKVPYSNCKSNLTPNWRERQNEGLYEALSLR